MREEVYLERRIERESKEGRRKGVDGHAGRRREGREEGKREREREQSTNRTEPNRTTTEEERREEKHDWTNLTAWLVRLGWLAGWLASCSSGLSVFCGLLFLFFVDALLFWVFGRLGRVEEEERRL